jgi:ribose transport system ATP-binding protein
VHVDGKRLRPGSVQSAVGAGVGLAPEERKSQALLLGDSVTTNITISSLTRFSRSGYLDRSGERRAAVDQVESLDVRPTGVDREMRTLSGGNQQKVVLAKWLSMKPRVVIFDEPTRGIDVGAKAEIHRLVTEMARNGVAVIMISSEMPEVLGMSDRIMVMHEGRVTGFLNRDEATQIKVMELAAQ